MVLILAVIGCPVGTGEAVDVGAPGDCGGTRDSADASDTADSGSDFGPPDSGDTGDPAPTDADRDGYPAETDCDDGDREVHPGAPDWCDGVDQDCDGDPVGAGMCADITSWDRLETRYWLGESSSQQLSTGKPGIVDGAPVLLGGAFDFEGTGASGWHSEMVLAGLPSEESPDWRPNLVGAWVDSDASDTFIQTLAAAGDFDADGFDDLWLSVYDILNDRYHLRLVLGPSSGWPKEGAHILESGDAVWEDTSAIGRQNPTVGDLDGDGAADFVLWVPRSDRSEFCVHWLSGALIPEASSLDDTILTSICGDGQGYLALAAADGADADGDGILDITTQAEPDGDGITDYYGDFHQVVAAHAAR